MNRDERLAIYRDLVETDELRPATSVVRWLLREIERLDARLQKRARKPARRGVSIKLVQLRKQRNVCTGCGDEPGTHSDPCPNDAEENRAEWEASVGRTRQRGPSPRLAISRLMAVW